MSILDDFAKIVEMVRRLDKFDLLDDVLDELLRLREKVRDLVEENRRLKERLRSRLQEEAEALPYEGVYWFESRELELS